MENKIFVGIDVSKGYADFCILNSNKQQVEDNFQLDDQKEGHEKLKEKLLDLATSNSVVIVGLENTGGYERNWFNTVKQFSIKHSLIKVYKLNPKAIKHQIQSLMKRVVDDSISAYGIALYVINHYQVHEEDWIKTNDKTTKLTSEQLLHSMIMGLIKQRTAKLNQLEKLIYSAFPELLKFTKNSFPVWVLRLLEKYPTSHRIKMAKINGLTTIKSITSTKAEKLKTLANNSVACLQDELIEAIIGQQSKDILYLNDEIDKLKELLVKTYSETPEVKIINSIKGIGDWTAVSFLIELGDYQRFNSTDQLASFFGVNPSFKQSGDGKYKVRMSKQGCARMRAVLYLIAHNLVIHNTYFRALYAKYRAKGKKHSVVMGILMHKVLRVLWGMLKSGKEFSEDIDIKNQDNNKEINDKPIELINSKSRRYQVLNLDAPVSRTNYKKRKATLEPQSSTMDENNEIMENSQVQT